MMQNGIRSKIVQAVKNILFIAGLIFLCISMAELFEMKESAIKYKPFIKEKKDIDVLYFGTSHVRCGFLPMELWEEYGITSYNFGGSSPEIATSYWNMMNALEHTNPKLVILDVSRITADRYVNKPESVHKEFDSFPLTLTKIRAVQDLFRENTVDANENEVYGRRLEMLWNFELYHTRWSDLTKEDFEYEATVEKGATSAYKVAKPAEYNLVPQNEYTEVDTLSVQYVKKMIEECQNRGIEILLTYLPGPLAEARQKKINYIYVVAEEYGVPFVNFMYENEILNYDVDFNDSSITSSHLNVSGAKKLTSWLGRYMKEQFALPDRRNDSEYSHWFADYEAYVKKKTEVLEKTQELNRYLAQIADRNYDIYLHVEEGSLAWKKDKVRKLLKNLSPKQELTEVVTAGKEGTSYWLHVDGSTGEAKESLSGSVFEEGLYWETNPEEKIEVQIAVVDKTTKEMVDVSEWYSTDDTMKRKKREASEEEESLKTEEMQEDAESGDEG